MKAMDRDLSDVQCHNCSMFGHYRTNCPNRRKQQYQGEQDQQQPNERQRMRSRQQRKNGGSGGGIWCSYHKTTAHRDADHRAQHNQDNDNANVSAVQPSRVDVRSALDLSEQDNEPGRPYLSFSATEVTPTAASTPIEKGTWPFGPLPTIRTAPHPWPFVERSKPTISLGEQNKPDVTHIHERANNVDDERIHGTALMALKSPRVENKPYHDEHQPVPSSWPSLLAPT